MEKLDQARDTAEGIPEAISASAPADAVFESGSDSESASSSQPEDTVFELVAETDPATSAEPRTQEDSASPSIPWDTALESPFETDAAAISASSVAEPQAGVDSASTPSGPAPQQGASAPPKTWREPSPSQLRWTQPEIPAHELSTRRTGVAFLSLILTTNSIPWMQIANRSTEGSELLPSSQAFMVVVTCLVAAILVILAWFFGRRLPMDWGPRIESPRDSGLMLAIVAAGLNLALAAIIRWHGAESNNSVVFFGVLWFLLVVPTQIGAAFCKGRASIPFALPRSPATQKAPVAIPSTRSAVERLRNTSK